MKSTQFLKEGFVEDANEVHADHEVQMARSDLFHAAEDALSLHKLLKNVSEQQGLEGWVAAKITLAADYLNTVREHVEYQLMSGAVPVASAMQTNELPIAEGVTEGHADQQRKIFKKNGKPVGEVGIDRESSPGVGQWYMKHYASAKDLAGYDSYDEAVEELKHLVKQGMSEGIENDFIYISKDNVREFEQFMDSEGFNIDVPRKKVGRFIVYDYNNEDVITKSYADDWNEKPQGMAEGTDEKDTNKKQPKKSGLDLSTLRTAAKTAKPASELPKKQEQGVAEVKFGPAATAALQQGKSPSEVAWADLRDKNNERYFRKIGTMESQKMQATSEDNGKPDIRPGMRTSQGTVVKVNGNTVIVKASNGDLMTMNIHDVSTADHMNEMSAGSVATVVNPTPKNKAKVGTLFGGTYKQKKTK